MEKQGEAVYKDKNHCSGCTACDVICPTSAISMKEDEKGFLYPVINEELCIHCHLCEKVCPYGDIFIHDKPAGGKYYAVKHRNKEVIKNSRSAGLFTALSDIILERGGIVYGACMDDDFVTRHHGTSNKDERDKYRKSKYVQSEKGKIFQQVKKDLKEGREVFFSGTTCECAGLKAYLQLGRIPQDKLILCDIICSGVPSPQLFAKYLDWLEKNEGKSKIKSYEFRDKIKYGWGRGIEKVCYENGKTAYQNYFTGGLFGKKLIMRESCYSCPYATLERLTDVTMGDFWGLESVAGEFRDEMGCSLLLVHTSKGEKIFEEAQSFLRVKQLPKEMVATSQSHLYIPSKMPDNYEEFWRDYCSQDFDNIIKKYTRNIVTPKYDRQVKMIMTIDKVKAILIRMGVKKVIKKVVKKQ